ncbi:NAD(P)-binding domain-containing protein [Chryseobacterium gambrini]|uniref:NAD(P)-binding domain-containing protein n=1 Tax=Chryseobacterium gambrini TaxID=373672 RepID=A0AAJ1VJH3_9FLAO|nr:MULTISPECIES: NAD(P)-binding domain-containing protein [Chryseobacterium]MDN4011676.1 NAD(P)-binding domain-containing protein [Chryseobacterium gambrini]MDN4029195.1 NAD(P)-binding domain-containing protein [Chryseobacterium gambrini]QWA39136.1 NAD(P)-binding domain-containing protein [Chryseobacterium sp. ZHDP1]
MNISFIGAGNVASNLGNLFTNAGHSVQFGTYNPKDNQLSVAEAISFGEVICFAIPFSAMNGVLTENRENLKGKIVVDITNAIHISDWSPVFLGEDSGGEQTARLLPESKVVKAFNTIFADAMKAEKQFNGQKLTAFIASDDQEAALIVKNLADEAGFNGFVVGGIKNAKHLEAMAHLNIAVALNGGGTDAGFIYVQNKNLKMENPAMQIWTESWRKADSENFKNIYANNALIFPPNKPVIQGNANILDFMKGGLGKVAVIFEPESMIISENLAFEYGIFKDVNLSDEKVLGSGTYSVTWILEDLVWKIHCHSWSMPVKE